MNRRERLMATLEGRAVDRPPVCFYEINGHDERPENTDPFNIFSDPSWKPALDLAREKTDRIVMRGLPWKNASPDPLEALTTVDTSFDAEGCRVTATRIAAPGRTLSARGRQHPDINTYWHLEHLLKDADDLRAWLETPEAELDGEPDTAEILQTEAALGDTGIVMLGVADPLCQVAEMFDMATFTQVATFEPELFHAALQRAARALYPRVEAMAKALPGRLWRIVGPEYASPPYLRPTQFRELVTGYDTPIVEAIQRHGGFARIHSHGRLADVLEHIVATGCVGLDPIEPTPQGDVRLLDVRAQFGEQLVLFGNLEASDLENLPTPQFAEKIETALREGTAGHGRGFVLMPSACPYGRQLSPLALANYEKMVELAERGV